MTIFHILDALEVVHVLVACVYVGITQKVCLSNRNIGQIC